jgi:acyl-CoA synthetase (AMP-forming)/AMP-acid ligase II
MSPVPWSDSLRVLAARFGDAPAVTDQDGASLSYRTLSDRAHALADVLDRRKVEAGTPVAVLLRNSLAAVWTAYGLRLAGAADVPLSWTATSREIAWAARLAQFELVVTGPERAGEMEALGLATLQPDSVPAGASADSARPAVPGGGTGRFLFSSGSTGAH